MADVQLCRHHTNTLDRWHHEYPHESETDYRKRRRDIAAACPTRIKETKP